MPPRARRPPAQGYDESGRKKLKGRTTHFKNPFALSQSLTILMTSDDIDRASAFAAFRSAAFTLGSKRMLVASGCFFTVRDPTGFAAEADLIGLLI
jgi:hypothetical protein